MNSSRSGYGAILRAAGLILVLLLFSSCVDLVIDGSGQGQTAPLGSGGGGQSTRSVAPGDSVIFTVDLITDVQGGTMTVAWNTPAGWTVTFDGGSSPLTNYPPGTYELRVVVPASAAAGTYDIVIDAWIEGTAFNYDSVLGRVIVVPPSVDALIDGNGDNVIGPPGSGAGGTSTRTGQAGSNVDFTLEIQNQGVQADSYTIQWNQIPMWTATLDMSPSPFVTGVIDPGTSAFYTFRVNVPPGEAPGNYSYIIDVLSNSDPSTAESVEAVVTVVQNEALIEGVVFDDADHDGVFAAGEAGIGGVTVIESNSGATMLTRGDGTFSMSVAGGTTVNMMEKNPSGYISLSPDALGPFTLMGGDTLRISFADVPPIDLSEGSVMTGLAGSYVDFPHSVTAGTKGRVTITASSSTGAVVMLFLDADGNGVFSSGDRNFVPSDGDLDPAAGRDRVDLLVRIFVPADALPGRSIDLDVHAEQVIEGTTLTSVDDAADVVVVVGSTLGRLKLSKSTDKSSALPGEVITYSIDFFNAGTDTIQNLVLLDPVSRFVDVVADAFGPGLDVEWARQGGAVQYLTLDPGDGDECEYIANENLLRIEFSKSTPIFILPGERGTVTYRVRVK